MPVVRLFAVGAGYTGGPRVRVYDETGGLRFDFFAFEHKLRSGVMVATADVNGDLIEDIIVAPGKGIGPRYEFTAYLPVPPFFEEYSGNAPIEDAGGPRVRVFSGADLSVLADFFAFEPSFTGGVRVAAGDLDGDGRAEVFAAAGHDGGPRVRGWAIEAGNPVPLDGPLGNFFAFDPALRVGATIAAGDLDGDGKAELVVGSPEADRSAQRVKVYGPDGAESAAFAPFGDLPDAHAFDVGVVAARGGVPGSILAGTVSGALFWRAFDLSGQLLIDAPTGVNNGPHGDPHLLLSDVAGIDYLGEPAVVAGFFNDDPLISGSIGLFSMTPTTDGRVQVYARTGGDPLLTLDNFTDGEDAIPFAGAPIFGGFRGGVSVG